MVMCWDWHRVHGGERDHGRERERARAEEGRTIGSQCVHVRAHMYKDCYLRRFWCRLGNGKYILSHPYRGTICRHNTHSVTHTHRKTGTCA